MASLIPCGENPWKYCHFVRQIPRLTDGDWMDDREADRRAHSLSPCCRHRTCCTNLIKGRPWASLLSFGNLLNNLVFIVGFRFDSQGAASWKGERRDLTVKMPKLAGTTTTENTVLENACTLTSFSMVATATEQLTLLAGTTVIVHPLVLLSVADHHARSVSRNSTKRVVGVLLGQDNGKIINVANSFGIPFEEDDKDSKTWFLDHNYVEGMWEMFKKVNGELDRCCSLSITKLHGSSEGTDDRVVPYRTQTQSIRSRDQRPLQTLCRSTSDGHR